MRENWTPNPEPPKLLRGEVLSYIPGKIQGRKIRTIGTPDDDGTNIVLDAIRDAFITTSGRCGYQLRMLVPPAVKKAIPIIASESEDRIELTSRASVTGRSARFAADSIIASLVKDSDFIWNVQSVKPEYFLRVIPGTGSQGDEIHHGMRAILTYLTRDEDNIDNVMKRDVMYEGWWQFNYSQEEPSPPLPDLKQRSNRSTVSDLDQKSSRLTEDRDQSNASWATPSDLGFRAKMYLRRSKAAQESHQRRRQRWENIKDYSSLVTQSDRTGIISEWLAEKFSQPSTKTQSGETVISRVLGSISDYLGTYADEHRGSIDSRSTRLRKSKERGHQNLNVIFDANGRKIYSPPPTRPRTAWNDIRKARRRIRNVQGYKTRPKRRSRDRGRYHRSGSSALDPSFNNGDDSSYPPRSRRQETVSIPLTDDRYTGRPGIDLRRSDSMYTGREERVLTSEEVFEAQARLATIEVKLRGLNDNPALIGKDRQAIWEQRQALISEQKELRDILGLPVEDLGPSQHSMSIPPRTGETGGSFPASSYPEQSSISRTLPSTSQVHLTIA
jgi:hypothetical protein